MAATLTRISSPAKQRAPDRQPVALVLHQPYSAVSVAAGPSLARRVPRAMVGPWSRDATPPGAGLRPPEGRVPRQAPDQSRRRPGLHAAGRTGRTRACRWKRPSPHGRSRRKVRDPSRFVRFRHGSLQRNGFHAFCLVIGHRHHLESGQYLSAMFQLTVRNLSGLVFPDLSTRNLMGWRISPVVWRTSLASATESPVSRPAYCLASNEGTNPVSPYSVTKPGGYQLANNCLVKRNTCCLHVGLFCQIQTNSN